MTLTAAIPLVHLFGLVDIVESVLPSAVQDFIERFVVVDYSTSHSDAAIFHRGSLPPIDAALDEIPTDFNIGIGRLSIPPLQTGIPLQLAFVRKAATGNLEPNPDVWRLDLSLDVFTLVVDGLQPAIFVREYGEHAASLGARPEPLVAQDHRPRRVPDRGPLADGLHHPVPGGPADAAEAPREGNVLGQEGWAPWGSNPRPTESPSLRLDGLRCLLTLLSTRPHAPRRSRCRPSSSVADRP